MPKAVKSTIELFCPSTWRRRVAVAVEKAIPLEVLAFLKSVPGERMSDDAMCYMEDAYDECGYCFDENKREELCDTVLKQFEFLRGYHGCRPVSLASYRREGLLGLTPERLAQMSFELFTGKIPLAELEKRVQQAGLDTCDGHICFCAHPEELIKECGHYLIYGAESLSGMWNSPEPDSARFHESQERSRQRGIPTILVCDVPIESIAAIFRNQLARTLITQHLQLASSHPVSPSDWESDWVFKITKNLPSSCIRDHYHPRRIHDPLRFGCIYHNPHTQCDWCAPSQG